MTIKFKRNELGVQGVRFELTFINVDVGGGSSEGSNKVFRQKERGRVEVVK